RSSPAAGWRHAWADRDRERRGSAMPSRFHWSLSQAGDPWRRAQATENMAGVLNLQPQIELCRHAERNGIESMLMAFSFARPDPLILATAIGAATEKIVFLVACRSGIFSPTA